MSSTLLWLGCVVIFAFILYTVITDKKTPHHSRELDDDHNNSHIVTKVKRQSAPKTLSISAEKIEKNLATTSSSEKSPKKAKASVKAQAKKVKDQEMAAANNSEPSMSAESLTETTNTKVDSEDTLVIGDLVEEVKTKTEIVPVANEITDVDIDEEQLHSLEAFANARKGRGGFDPESDRILANSKYHKRQRNTLILGGLTVVSFILAFILSSKLFIISLLSLTILVLYLVYLRQAVNLEENIRKQRLDRLLQERNKAIANGFNLDDYNSKISVNSEVEKLRGLKAIYLDEINPDFVFLPTQKAFQKTGEITDGFQSVAG